MQETSLEETLERKSFMGYLSGVTKNHSEESDALRVFGGDALFVFLVHLVYTVVQHLEEYWPLLHKMFRPQRCLHKSRDINWRVCIYVHIHMLLLIRQYMHIMYYYLYTIIEIIRNT